MGALSLWSHRLVCILKHRHFQNTDYDCTIFSILLVLGMTGMELTFFIAAHMMLCFGSVVKTVLITNSLSQNHAYTASRPFIFFPCTFPKWVGWGRHEAGMGHRQNKWSKLAEGIHTPSSKTCSAINAGVKEEGSWGIVSQGVCCLTTGWAVCS